jgi:anti-anti-sigma regulatory factor
MPIEPILITVDGDGGLAAALEQAAGRLNPAEGDVLVDLSEVARVDAAAIRALKGLVQAAEGNGVTISLRGVNVGVYKVLKLMKHSGRVQFVS